MNESGYSRQMGRQVRIRELQQKTESFNLRLNLEDLINQQQLYQVLAKMCLSNEQYDQEIFNELCERVIQEFGQLTVNNFLYVYTEAEEILQLKVEHMDQMVERNFQNCKYLSEIIQELNKKKFGVRPSVPYNFLMITSIQIHNIVTLTHEQAEPFLMIKMGTMAKDTSPQFGNNPFFNLNIQMPVHSFLEDLVILVLDKKKDNLTYEPIEYGQVDIQVDALPFFENKSARYKLYKDKNLIDTEVTINCYNEVNNYDGAVQDLRQRIVQFEEKIAESSEEKKLFQDQLNCLKQPFSQSFISPINNQNNYIAPPYNRNLNINVTNRSLDSEQQFGNIGANMFEDFDKSEYQNSTKFKNTVIQEDEAEQQKYKSTERLKQEQKVYQDERPQARSKHVQEESEENLFECFYEIIYKPQILTLIWLALACFISFFRPVLADITISVLFLIFLFTKFFDAETFQTKIRLFMGMIVLSGAVDVFWLIIYYPQYQIDSQTIDQGQERVLRIFTLVLSFINLIFKIPLCASYYWLASQFNHLALVELSIQA